MTLTVPQGLRIANGDFADDRAAFDTVAEALQRIGMPRRRDGLPVWIRSERRTYRFIDGITDAHFVPDPVQGSNDSAITALDTETINQILTQTGFPTIT